MADIISVIGNKGGTGKTTISHMLAHGVALLGAGVHYLEDSGGRVGGLSVWGSPWQPEFGDLVVLSLGVVLGLAMLAISCNTIGLQVLTRTEEIAVMRLFGATSAYVRRPFLYFGAVQGAAAALLAWAVICGSLVLIEPRVAALLGAYGLAGRLVGLSIADGLALLGFSALVGLLGAWLAVAER